MHPEHHDMTPEERKDHELEMNRRWYRAWRHSMANEGMAEKPDGSFGIFPTADTTTPRMIVHWCPHPGTSTFHWKVLFMGSYEQATKGIKQLRELTLNRPGYEPADYMLVKQAKV